MRTSLGMLLVLLLLTACGTGGPAEVDRFSGSEGLVIEFAENAPPETVFENTPFPVKVNLRNRGAIDVAYEDIMLTFTTDPLYIGGGVTPYLPSQHDPQRDVIYGKDLSYPDGESRLYSIPASFAFYTKPIYGTRERPETTLIASACYKYNTIASSDVCIDTNVYEQNEREQPCVQEDISFSGGQGAPIAVTSVSVNSIPVIDRQLGIESVRPHFLISIKDVGKGRLIGHDDLSLDTACFLKGMSPEEVGTIKINAWLLRTELECKPAHVVQMHEGEAKVECSVPVNDLTNPIYSSAQNFQTTLVINISYIYKENTRAELEIQRVSGIERGAEGVFPGDLAAYGRESGYTYDAGGNPVLDDQGYVYTQCRYYAENPEKRPAEATMIDARFSCACGREECIRFSRDGRCIFGYCPGSNECCVKEAAAVSTEVAWPTMSKAINSCYGERMLGGNADFHDGIDIQVSTGTSVFAFDDGVVEAVCTGYCSGYGNNVILKHDSIYTRYSHMSTVSVREGQPVIKGQTVGTSGNTGASQGPHLDFKVYVGSDFGKDKAKDPLCFFPKEVLQGISTTSIAYSCNDRYASFTPDEITSKCLLA